MGEDRGATDPASSLAPLLASIAYVREEPTVGARGGASTAATLQAAADSQLDYLLGQAPRAADGTLYHLVDAKEFWIDSMYMAPPALAAAGYPDEAVAQIEGLRARLFLPEKGLFAHRWDDANGRFIRRAAWGVGNGWAAAGMARVAAALPSGSAARESLARYVRELADAWLPFRTPDGLFHDVVDDPSTFIETNAAQMLAYSLFRGVAEGWLPPEYQKEALSLRMSVRAKVDALGFVRASCGAPLFDGPGVAPEAQAFFHLMHAAAAAAGLFV